jgi:hypothetical protein
MLEGVVDQVLYRSLACRWVVLELPGLAVDAKR